MIKEHSREIFGENSFYFDVKHVLKTPSGIGSIPDAYVIRLSKPSEWYVVENELSTHSVYNHIVNQLTRFINGIKNQDARNQILGTLYDEINKDGILKAKVKKLIDTDDIHHFLSKLLSTPPRIVVVIDQKTPETEEACQSLNIEHIVEFKTYVRENAPNVLAHIFEPLDKSLSIQLPTPPRPHRTWEEMLKLANESVRDATSQLLKRVIQLGNVNHKPSGNMYTCFKGRPTSDSRFLGMFLTSKALKLRIRTDPATFKDPEKWTGDKTYRWFFKTGEKEFKLTSKEQIDYATYLIEQSYQSAK